MISRRAFVQSAGLAVAALSQGATSEEPLTEFGYGDVKLASGPAQTQFEQTQSVLLSLDENSLLKPWRLRAGLPSPGPDLGGWYDEVPLDKTESGGHGFAPAHCFGQWLSALARGYAVTGDARTLAKLERLLTLYGAAISGKFYANFRFPAYNYDKMVIGLSDAHQFAHVESAKQLLDRTTDAAEPHLPPEALDRDEPQRRWRASIGENTANDYTWDESYTLPENLFLAWERGAGNRYRQLARRFLLDRTYFDPLAENRNVLGGHHAYSFANAMSSAMQAYLADGSQKHLRAAANAFEMITTTQSFATGGWGPNESFSTPGSGELFASLSETHRGFETPCGSYAHAKLTRYLLRVTRDARYGDSLERVLYNTVLGALPLESNGRAFYYSDYHSPGGKTYFPDAWPCCSGTLPQIAADYRIMTYFRDRDGVFVNLFLLSKLRWTTAEGAEFSLIQTGDYPYSGRISLSLRGSRPSRFSLRVRVPAWAQEAAIRVNDEPITIVTKKGFATVNRRWQSGDRVDLDFAMPLRLEPVDADHPNTVALLSGPLVLFPLTTDLPAVTRQQLLSARKMSSALDWQIRTATGELQLRPFLDIGEQRYTTYFKLT